MEATRWAAAEPTMQSRAIAAKVMRIGMVPRFPVCCSRGRFRSARARKRAGSVRFKRAGWIEPDAAQRSQQEREGGFARLLRLQREKMVGAGSAKIDCGHRFSEVRGALNKAKAR